MIRLQLYDLVEHKIQGDGNCQPFPPPMKLCKENGPRPWAEQKASWQGIEVAVKKLGEEVTADEDKMRAFRDELELLQKIRHPNVVQFLGAVTQSTPMMIVTEYLPKPSNSNSSHNHQRFGTSLMRKLKRCFSCYKPTEPRSKEKYKGKMSSNLSEKASGGDGGYSEMIQNAISYCKDSLIKGDAKANETPIEEPETEAKVLDIPSPCSMDIDSQTNNQLPQVINGVPKGLRIEDVLVRNAVLLLIRDKVKAASEKPGTPLFPDDIVSRFPGLKSGRFWKEHHDLLLLRAVLKHGYGRWQAIVDDKDLKVQEVICQELNLPVVTLPVPGASQSQDGANVVSAETPMNETKGTVVGNDLAVDAANRAPDAANRSQLFQDSSSLHHYREMQRRQVEFIKKKVLFLEKLLNTEYQKEAFKLDVNVPTCEQREPSTTGHWEEKVLVSRDGQAKLKANIFFASFDQRSDKAAGESACTVLAAVIANWLQSNQDNMPTRAQFDRLIVEGSSEWRKLCDNQDLINQFPDKHFDIETVLQAGLCPISVLHEKSFIGFFGPEKFETLKGVMSFDQIWDEIKKNAKGDNDMPRIYIVSWNDHFFVLKVDVNAYYIIDTFGERLFEGCNQAYILRFDDSALMRGKIEKEGVSSDQASEDEICSGKECCREFMKRFLAAIPLRELESEEKKESVSYFALHQRLQIEFNFTTSLSLSSSSSASSTNSTSSLFSNESTNSMEYMTIDFEKKNWKSLLWGERERESTKNNRVILKTPLSLLSSFCFVLFLFLFLSLYE